MKKKIGLFLALTLAAGQCEAQPVPWLNLDDERFQCSANETTIAKFGRDVSGTFQPLFEVNTRQQLTKFSGMDRGRGAIKLYDHVDGDSMELGFYRWGAGLFHSGMFEFWTTGVSIRQLSGASASYLGVRDVNDEKQIKFSHNVTNGVISTDDSPTDSGAAGGISIRPNTAESWLFEQTTGDLDGNASNGGNIVFTRGQKTVIETTNDNFAATGTNQGAAAALTSTVTSIKTIDGSNDGVKLPVITSGIIGSKIEIHNAHATLAAKVYPGTGDEINTTGANVATSVATQKTLWCRAASLGHWRCALSA